MLSNGIYALKKKSKTLWMLTPCQLQAFQSWQPEEKNIAVFLQWHATWMICIKCARENLKASKKGKKILWGACDKSSARRLKLFGVNAKCLQHNLLCREDIFCAGENTPTWDAIYIGALSAYKRPSLAKNIPSLRILARNYNETGPETLRHFKIPHAAINTTWMPRRDVHKEILKSRCGLALSKTEGSMNATTEYLLCGIPIVSTPSKGGRDLWFTPHNHILCPPTPEGVAQAVASFKNTQADHKRIADDALNFLLEQRRNFSAACESTFAMVIDETDLQTKNLEFFLNNNQTYQLVNLEENPDPRAHKNQR